MSDYIRRARRREEKSSGGVAINILIFLGGAVLVLGGVIWYENSRAAEGPAMRPLAGGAAVTASAGDSAYIERGFQPNRPADNGRARVSPVQAPAAARFVGDSEFKQYHRPDCKTLQYIDATHQFPLASAADAFAKGLIPCKVCRPESPASVAQGPSTPDQTAPPVKPPDTSVSRPLKDVTVPFPFTVLGRDVVAEKGVIRIEFEVEVEQPLQKDDVLLLAQKLVAQEVAKGPINAVSVFVHTNPQKKSMVKWLGSADWAPYGVLTRAGEVKAGDYKYHKFTSGPFQGFFNPNAR